jgi:hypothetical protein
MHLAVHFIFTCGLFNNTVSSSDYIASNNRMNNEFKRMWKEVVNDPVQGTILAVSGGAEKTIKSLSQSGWSLDQDSNPGPLDLLNMKQEF